MTEVAERQALTHVCDEILEAVRVFSDNLQSPAEYLASHGRPHDRAVVESILQSLGELKVVASRASSSSVGYDEIGRMSTAERFG